MNILNLEKQLFYKNLFFRKRINEIFKSLPEQELYDFCIVNKDSLTNDNWTSLIILRPLSENFIREFFNHFPPDYICGCQKLSENFIDEFADQLDWEVIIIYQSLSNEFIKKSLNKLNKLHLLKLIKKEC